MEQEIITSGLTCEQIVQFLQDNSELLVEFTVEFLQQDTASRAQYKQDEVAIRSEGFAVGFGITHAIYLYYLMYRSRASLREYLVKRHIPCAAQVVEQLIRAFEKAKVIR